VDVANIAVIDYGMGNLHSACKGLEKAGATPQITDSPLKIAEADAVVLPGVGAFDPSMIELRKRNLESAVQKAIASGKPFLGICVGFQMLFDSSEEGIEPGLGIIPGKVKHFQHEPNITFKATQSHFMEKFKSESLCLFRSFLLCGFAR
jgi:imidazole glycerol-phosphate synthase subunit HisH